MRTTTVLATLALSAAAASAYNLDAREDNFSDVVAREDFEEFFAREADIEDLAAREVPSDDLVSREDFEEFSARDDALEDLTAREDPFDDLVAREDFEEFFARDNSFDDLLAREDMDELVAREPEPKNIQNTFDTLIAAGVHQGYKRHLAGDLFGSVMNAFGGSPFSGKGKKTKTTAHAHEHAYSSSTGAPSTPPPAAPVPAEPAPPTSPPPADPGAVNSGVPPVDVNAPVAVDNPPTAREYIDMLEERSLENQYMRDLTSELVRRTRSKGKSAGPRKIVSSTSKAQGGKPKQKSGNLLKKVSRVAQKGAVAADHLTGLASSAAGLVQAGKELKNSFTGHAQQEEYGRRDYVEELVRRLFEDLDERDFYDDLD